MFKLVGKKKLYSYLLCQNYFSSHMREGVCGPSLHQRFVNNHDHFPGQHDYSLKVNNLIVYNDAPFSSIQCYLWKIHLKSSLPPLLLLPNNSIILPPQSPNLLPHPPSLPSSKTTYFLFHHKTIYSINLGNTVPSLE